MNNQSEGINIWTFSSPGSYEFYRYSGSEDLLIKFEESVLGLWRIGCEQELTTEMYLTLYLR